MHRVHGLHVDDWDRSWMDGRAFALLLHHVAPALVAPLEEVLLPAASRNHRNSAALRNAELTFGEARLHLNVW
jgi:hypothetical protein